MGTERLADRDGAAGWEMRRWAEMAADRDRAVIVVVDKDHTAVRPLMVNRPSNFVVV